MTKVEIEVLMEAIKDYVACSDYMCKLLKDNFDTKGESILRARRINLIPKEGVLTEGCYFNFHGGGCYFKFDNSVIDIEFGPNDRCDGFDSQRLLEFIESSNKKYLGLSSKDKINKKLQILMENGYIFKPNWYPNPHLMYLKN